MKAYEMEFYFAWWPGDARYHFYDENAYLLINVSILSKIWNIVRAGKSKVRPWSHKDELIYPKKLILSAGKASQRKEKGFITIENVLNRQLCLIGDLIFEEVLFCHPDILVSLDNGSERDYEKNIENAEEYFRLIERRSIPDFITPVGIVHGSNPEYLEECATRLTEIGYKYLALGNRELTSRYDRERIAKGINVIKEKGIRLHVLGVSSFDLFNRYPSIVERVNSIDSSTPISEGKNIGVYFSREETLLPGIIRYKICTPNLWPLKAKTPWLARYGFAGLICTPFNWPNETCSKICHKYPGLQKRIVYDATLSCNCSACKIHGFSKVILVRSKGQKILNNRRAIHNAFHMKKELELLCKKGDSELANNFTERKSRITPP